MLYDPKWEVKADPLTLDGLIAWLEKQPADAGYDFCEIGKCLLAQWVLSIDPQSPLPTGQEIDGGAYEYVVHGRVIDLHEFKDIACSGHTFGGALVLARALSRT